MSFAELMPALQMLPKADKLRAIQLLVSDLTRQEEPEQMLEDGSSYPIWTPFEAYDAAQALLELLDKDREAS